MKNKLLDIVAKNLHPCNSMYKKSRENTSQRIVNAILESNLTTEAKDLAELMDEYYNSEEGIKFMKSRDALKEE